MAKTLFYISSEVHFFAALREFTTNIRIWSFYCAKSRKISLHNQKVCATCAGNAHKVSLKPLKFSFWSLKVFFWRHHQTSEIEEESLEKIALKWLELSFTNLGRLISLPLSGSLVQNFEFGRFLHKKSQTCESTRNFIEIRISTSKTRHLSFKKVVPQLN